MNSSIQTLNLNNTNINTNISIPKATTNVVNLELNSIGINSKNIVNNFSSYNTDSNDILNENGFTEREYTLEELLEESDKYRRNVFIASKSMYADISAVLSELSFSERLLLDTNAVCSELSLTREKDFETIWEEAEAYRKKIAEKIAKDKKAASNVENIINKIKLPITLDLANDVNNALAAYESLTSDQIKYLDEETIKKLEDAKKEIDRLEAEKKAKELEIAQKKQELEDLYKKREANNGFFHPQIEDEIEEKILKLEKELGVPHKPDGFESFVDSATNVIDTIQDYAQTAVVSFTTGVLDVVEGIGDGIIMAGGALSSSVVGIFDEEMAAEIEAATQSIVQYDWTNKIYDETMAALDVDPEIAYGMLHDITSAAGTMVGYAALSMIPGGTVVVAAASGLAAMGSASENAFRNGATFDEALAAGTSNAIIGAISGGATSKIGTLAKGSTSLLKTTGYTLAGVGIGAGEPLLNSFVEYATYGNNDGKSYLEFMDQSGGWWNVGIGGGAGGLSTGFQGFKGYTKNKYKADFNANMDSMTDAQRSQAWADYFGDDVIEHASGIDVEGHNGVFVDPKASEFNVSMDKWYETFSYKKDGDRLHDITELKNFISSYTSDLKLDLNNYLLSQKDIDDIVAIYYTRGTAEFDEISTILKQYSDDALHVSMDNYVWKQASADLSLYGLDKIESYAYHYDSNKGIVIDYVARDNSGNTVNRSISRSVDDFDLKVLKDRDDLLIDMILHKEDDLIRAGKVISPIKEYDSLIHWNSAEESWNNMTDVAKQEFLKPSPNIQIASDGTKAQFGFFSFGTYVDGNNITSLGIPDSTAIGKTQWSTELISLRETLSNTSTFRTVSGKTVEVNVMNLSDPFVFTDQDIAELADVLTARPRATKAQDIRFIAHDVNKTPLNVTSNSYAGANNQYAGNSSTMANVREINAGPVDKNTSIVLGVDGIRKMFIEMLK